MHYSNRFMRRLLGPSIFIEGVNVYKSVLPVHSLSRVWGTSEVLHTVPVDLFLRQIKAMTMVPIIKESPNPTRTIIHIIDMSCS